MINVQQSDEGLCKEVIKSNCVCFYIETVTLTSVLKVID